ncbi:RAI1 like PD-XK nuclease-domain-containing protein [Phlyctochytrium arcticum]|nr:RAI1 like PD-XK nuclease-domain-containing protein [Phlyctochytrium arcticum]
MTKIMCTPYSRDDWELGITNTQGTIYMEEHESDEKRQSNYGSSERDKLMTYWGYKFESLSTIDKPPSKITGSDDPVLKERLVETVDTNLQFCSVVKTKLGGKTLVLGAEVDCLTGDSKAPHERQKAYAELKTSRIISNDRQRNSFERHKLLKIWAQSFLSGVGTIIVGFRDDNGHVQTLQQLETLNIPRMVRNSQAGIWDATVCINFASSFLDWVQKVVATEDDADVVVTVRLSNGGKEVVIVRKEVGREGTEIFIPQWYRK